MIGLLLIVLLVIAVVLVPRYWTRTIADLAWMFVMRPALVGTLVLVLFALVAWAIHLLLHLSYVSPTILLLAIIVIPLVGGRLANWIARTLEVVRYRDNEQVLNALPEIKTFIFAYYKMGQDAAYEVPQVEP